MDDISYQLGRAIALLDTVKVILSKGKYLSTEDRKILLTLLNAPVEEEQPEATEEPLIAPDGGSLWDEERGLT